MTWLERAMFFCEFIDLNDVSLQETYFSKTFNIYFQVKISVLFPPVVPLDLSMRHPQSPLLALSFMALFPILNLFFF